MITATMNSRELFDSISADLPRIQAYCQYRFKEMQRQCIKLRKKRLMRSIEYSCNGTDYILVLRVEKKSCYCDIGIYAHIKETNEYVNYGDKNQRINPVVCMTGHYIKRYAERILGDASTPAKEVLLRMNIDILGMARINVSGNFAVFLCRKGLIFAEADMKRKILRYNTFVGIDMLKQSQARACLKMVEILKRYDDDVRKYGEENVDVTSYWDKDFILSSMEANSLYEEFNETNRKIHERKAMKQRRQQSLKNKKYGKDN